MGLIKCATADPPWEEKGAGQCKRGADRHYPVMPKEQILIQMADWMGLWWWSGAPRPDCRIDVEGGCHLWIWVTDNFMLAGAWIMAQLGFKYIRTMQWVKMRDLGEKAEAWTGTLGDVCRLQLQIGLGQYMRGAHEMALLGMRAPGIYPGMDDAHEMALFGVRGESMRPPTEDRMPSVIFAERGRHSEKPDEAIEVFERVSPGPRLEMFARTPRPGWEVVGNEV